MRVFNGKLAALTLALMMVCGTGRSLMAEGVPADTVGAGTPITFEDAVQIALKQNITLAQAQNAVASDAASVRGAKLGFLPNLQLTTGGSQVYGRNFNETTGDVLNRNNQSLNAGISSSITLFNGLQNVATLHEAQKNQDAGELDLTRAKQTTVFTVASNYLSIITAQEQLEVQQENLASLQAQEDEIKKMVDAGARAISDLYSQQASTAAARLAVVNAQHDLELGKVDLVQTLRLDPKVTYNFIAPTVS
ncbi:MAG TPA: TolC family protein, partial [Gemmatimonadaceae bacterium]